MIQSRVRSYKFKKDIIIVFVYNVITFIIVSQSRFNIGKQILLIVQCVVFIGKNWKQ